MLPVNYLIEDQSGGGERLVHVSRLKRCIERVLPRCMPEYVRADDPVDMESDLVEVSESQQQRRTPNEADAPIDTAVDETAEVHAEVDVDAYWPDKPSEVINGVPYYEPTKIIDVRWRVKHGRRQRQYLVQWKDHDGEDSWEPSHKLKHCGEVVEEFRTRVEEGLSR